MALSLDRSTLIGLGVAALIGLVVGIERQWAGKASGPQARFGGMRTFFMLGVVGGMAGVLLVLGWPILAAIILAGGMALIVTAYLVTSRRPGAEPDATTEVAALLVLVLALAAAMGYPLVAAGIAALMVLALREKTALHRLVKRIDDQELRAAFQFAVMALVVLPLLPEGPYGPLNGIRPRSLWAVVLLFSGLSFAGYIARRIAGATLGYPITGLLGGLLSSTAVTLQFSRHSKREPALSIPLALGVLAACIVLLPRVAIVTAILNPAVARALLPFLIPPAIVGFAIIGWALVRKRQGDTDKAQLTDKNPLRLLTAIGMAVALQAVIMAIVFVRETWGSSAVLASAAVLGLSDVDALTFSMSSMGTTPDLVDLAARAIALGILTNTAVKIGLAAVLGAPAFRWRTALGLMVLGGSLGIGLLIGW
jgi:uncharacterized membrane protein (DUF4010 family)